MTSSTLFDQHLGHIEAGESLPAETIRELVSSPDILPLGMLADAFRRRLHGLKTTYCAWRFARSTRRSPMPSLWPRVRYGSTGIRRRST